MRSTCSNCKVAKVHARPWLCSECAGLDPCVKAAFTEGYAKALADVREEAAGMSRDSFAAGMIRAVADRLEAGEKEGA